MADDRVGQIIDGFGRLDERLKAVIDRLDGLAESTAAKSTVEHLERRVASLESDRARLGWMVMAAVITALLGLVVGLRP